MKVIANIGGSALLIFIAVFCTFGALLSAFPLTVSMETLFFSWLFNAVIASVVATTFRSKGIIALFAFALVLLFLWWNDFTLGLQWSFHSVTTLFNEWLPVRVLFPEIIDYIEYVGYYYFEPTTFFLIVGVVVCNFLAIAVCLRRSVLLTALFTAPIVFITFIITHMHPNFFFVVGLLAIYMSVFLSSILNPDDFIKRGLSFIPALVLALLFMGVSYLIAMPQRHNREGFAQPANIQIRTMAAQMGLWWQQSPFGTSFDFGWPALSAPGIWRFDTTSVDIADAGVRQLHGIELLEVISSEPGTFYLRGYSMPYFDGRTWHRNLPDTSDATNPIHHEHEEVVMTVPARIAHISAPALNNVLEGRSLDIEPPMPVTMAITKIGDLTGIEYMPYHSLHTNDSYNHFYHIQDKIFASFEIFDDNSIIQFNFPFSGTSLATFFTSAIIFLEPDGSYTHEHAFPDYAPHETLVTYLERLALYSELIEEYELYTSINPETAEVLLDIALQAGIDPNSDRAVIADSVTSFIRGSATYSLNAIVTPPYEDFTLHFLQTAEVGYCIHFATAATMMLRALNVPARFVTGYVVNVSPDEVDQMVVLTDMNAHAWVEVFFDDFGWLYFEATPSSENNIAPSVVPHFPDTPVRDFEPPDITPPDYDHLMNGASETPDDFTPNGDNGYADDQLDGTATNVESAPQWVSGLQRFLTVMSVVVAAILLVVARSNVMRTIRKKRFADKNTNSATIYAWRYLEKIAKNDVNLSGKIEALALKASFSQHSLTEDERYTVTSYAEQKASEIYKGCTTSKQLWMKYIRAII